MAARRKPKPAPEPLPGIRFSSSGCTPLDLALGGGWALGRVANLVGDRSSGKTLLAIEAATNFGLAHPAGSIWYRETEHAFDEHYARSLGMPFERVELGHLDTVEDLYDDLGKVIDKAPKPAIYILDSLDALSDIHEQERGFRSATYGTDKAAALSELFRRQVSPMAKAGVTLMIVSQVRSRIGGLPYGKNWVRAGGRALDFYASQVLYLTQKSLVKREVQGIERVTGIAVRARMEKNKVSMPFREAEFEIVFGYGVDDNKAMVAFLDQNKALNGDQPKLLLKALRAEGAEELRGQVRARVVQRWAEIETAFLPTARKY